MMNNGDQTFSDHAKAVAIEPPPEGAIREKIGINRNRPATSVPPPSAISTGDGRLDILDNNFNDSRYYFRNRFPRQNCVAFRLAGTKSNRDAIGTVVKLHVMKSILTRQVHPAGGYLAQSSRTLHFGLGRHRAHCRSGRNPLAGPQNTGGNRGRGHQHEARHRGKAGTAATAMIQPHPDLCPLVPLLT